jgi:hypothetical protein
MKVIVYSIGRSGSTLIEQITSAHSDVKVRHSHTKVQNYLRRKMIVPYRDFRSVLVSYWRTSADIPMEALAHGRKMRREEILDYTKRITDNVLVMEDNLHRNGHSLVLKYEEFYNDFEFLFDEIGGYINRPYTQNKRADLRDKFNIQSNRKRAEKLSNFGQWDKDGIHGGHVLTGAPDSWRDLVSVEDHEMFNEGLSDVLKRWGYSTLW